MAAVALLVLFCLPLLWRWLSSPPQGDLPKLVPGSFHAEPEQLAQMGITRADMHSFPGLVTADGAIAANDDTTTPVYSPFTGAAVRILAAAGDSVEKGQPLLIVSATEAMQAEYDLVSAAGAARSAATAARNATEAEARQHTLFLDGSVALKDWHQAQVDLAAAQSAQQSADAALVSARGKLQVLGFTPGQVEHLEHLRDIRHLTPEAAVPAPVSGIVLQRQVGPGQYLQAGGATPVFSIGNPATLWLVGNVPEEQAAGLRAGAAVDATVPALPGRVLHARLSWVASAIDPATHRLAVRAVIANPDGMLKPDMFASLTIHAGGDRRSPAVPERAVVREGEDTHLWVVSGDGDLSQRDIRTGRSQDGFIEVLAGLKPGERFASSGGLFLDSAQEN
jgi:cobalt-zinc-cadmium efflux system membrane fusion protein